jgi:uncharacterized protein YbjT (DUF2867 family)
MILIAGVTGVLGREAALRLLALGEPVRGMTRFPEHASDLKALGAEIIQADLIDKTSLDRACKGVDAVLACAHQLMGKGKYSSQAVDGEGHRALIEAARAARVQHFVYTSLYKITPDNPVDFIRTKAEIEAYLQASGLSFTILRPPSFMEWHVHNLLGKSILETGKTTIYGAGNNLINFMAGRDVAYMAVLALTDPRLKQRIIDIGGCDNLTRNQVAEMYGRLAGITPKITHIPTGMMKMMAPILRPINPVISRLMTFSVWTDTTDQTFHPEAMLKEFPLNLMTVEGFIHQQVAKN